MKQKLIGLLILLIFLAGCSKKPCTQHVDQDKNEICDQCSQSVVIIVDFYCINDLHGRFLDSSSQPGLDEMTTYLRAAGETDDHLLLLSTGDMWQGSAESNLTKGRLITDWMNTMDFQAMALGNHEFDWGESYISENADLAEFPFLAINVYDTQTDALADYCVPSRLVECNGVQIGLIGAIGDCHSSIAAEMAQGVYFVTGASLTQLVKAESRALREQGADFIVYLLHDGMGSSASGTPTPVESGLLSGYYDVALSDGYVDLVFEGHSHQRYILEDEYGVLHLQNGGDNTGGLSHVEISVHAIEGTASVRQAELIRGTSYEAMEDSPLIREILEKYENEVSPALESFATLNTSVPGNDLRQAVADLYYLEGLARWGAEYDIALGGGFISIRNPGYLARGEITYGDLMELFPFDNELVLCAIRGKDLIERFLESDNTNYFICCDENLTKNIDEDAIYYIVVDSYSSTYGPNRLIEIERYGEAYYARDMLMNYIYNGGFH